MGQSVLLGPSAKQLHDVMFLQDVIYGSGDWRLCPELRKNDRFNMLKMDVYANGWLSQGMIAMTHLKSSFSM